MKAYCFLLLVLSQTFSFLWSAEKPHQFAKVGSDFIYSDLKKEDSREAVMNKLRKGGFLQIYEERDKELVKCSLRLNGFRYGLAAKLNEDKLQFCLIEGQKGWQFSFYEEVVQPQWKNLREILIETYGEKREHRKFPNLHDVPFNDEGGYLTDTWDLSDRLIMLTIQFFEVKDCCTDQMVEYSCCTLLIQPKPKK
ncbi:MAG: hypothetical protein QNL93_05830 [Opitutae bacterium]|jgi:hypothetical protein|tara:strand:+ start:1186 stop:1770 length:585 start_codon:yes stop_codon:yes gene_type:complete